VSGCIFFVSDVQAKIFASMIVVKVRAVLMFS